MSEAVTNYSAYRSGNYSWMLGRFVVAADRLEELIETAGEFTSKDAEANWRVAVVIGDDVYKTTQRIAALNENNEQGIVCDTVEIKTDSSALIEDTAKNLPAGITAYFEVPLDQNLADLISTLAITGQKAKIRTGGLTADAFPSAQEIVRFVRTCAAANVPFKATAGLHHPIRCFKPLTYESDSPTGSMHGFLNLFLMTGFTREGFRPSLLVHLLEEELEEVFRFDEQTVVWRDEFTLSSWHIERLRKYGIQSFGSCSFEEPIAELKELGVL
jgi:hypothetical protein